MATTRTRAAARANPVDESTVPPLNTHTKRRRVQNTLAQDETPEISVVTGGDPTSSTNTAEVISEFAKVLAAALQPRPAAPKTILSGDGIPMLDPSDKKGKKIGQWLEQVDQLRRIHGWSDASAIHFSSTKLSGVAKT